MSDIFYTTAQAAEYLGVTPSRVRQLILENRLPAIKVGRDQLIKRNDLEKFATIPRPRTGRPPQI